MNVHSEWNRLPGSNLGEVLSFTTNLVREYWRLTDERPEDWVQRLNAYRMAALKGDYGWVFSVSAEFILEETGIDLPYPLAYFGDRNVLDK